MKSELASPHYAGPPEGTFVEVPRGAGPNVIADALVRAGVLRRTLPFTLYIRLTGASRRLQAGEYRFDKPATPVQVVDRIVRGDVHFVSVTIPEGLTAQETLEHIAANGIGKAAEYAAILPRTDLIQDLAPNARSLEGFLYPETYRFTRSLSSEEVVRSLVSQFRTKFQTLTQAHPPQAGWDVLRVVTLASMVEKEVGNKDERPLVASVLVNRLEIGMPLGCDPTVIYALKLAGRYDGNIRKADLSMDSPYNTYVRAGLPPGPIANPGADSLRAALAPAESDFLYFVSRNDGTHQFSRDYKTHSLAVNRFQRKGN
jgi:UPF0755 protein